jgi:hypothetical protein
MRIRTIKPEFHKDEKLASLPRDARLMFVGIWNLSDDFGVCRGHPALIRSEIFPYDDIPLTQISEWLAGLEAINCVTPFEVDGEKFFYINHFQKHQVIQRPSQSTRNPPPPDHILNEHSVRAQRGLNEPSMMTQENSVQEGKGREGNRKGKERKGTICSEPETSFGSKPMDSPIFVSLTLNDKTEHPISESDVNEWVGLYPGLDVPGELRKMKAWSDANPTKRKTRRGVRAFVVNWLNRSQDRSCGNGRHPPPQPEDPYEAWVRKRTAQQNAQKDDPK